MKKGIDLAYQKYVTEKLEELFKIKGKPEEREFSIKSIQIGKKWNFIGSDGDLLNNELYDEVWEFHDGWARVEKDGKYNYINEKGELYSPNKWYGEASDFYNGVAFAIERGSAYYTYIGKGITGFDDKKMLKAGPFEGDYAVVKTEQGYNIVNRNGDYILPEFYDYIDNFSCDRAVVGKNNLYNYIMIHNNSSSFLSEKWFTSASAFKNGYAKVEEYDDAGYLDYFIDIHGNRKPYDYIEIKEESGANPTLVKKADLYNFIDQEGNLISNRWFKIAYNFCKGYAIVGDYIDGELYYNFIDSKGHLLCNDWYYKVHNFHDGYAVVYGDRKFGHSNDMWGHINTKGEHMPCYGEGADDFEDGLGRVNWSGYHIENEKFFNKDYELVDCTYHRKFYNGISSYYDRANYNYCFINDKYKKINNSTYDSSDMYYKFLDPYPNAIINEEVIKLKHLPYVIFQVRYIYCVDDSPINPDNDRHMPLHAIMDKGKNITFYTKKGYLYDRKTGEYKSFPEGSYYMDGLICAKENGQVKKLFIYDGHIIDVTEYTKKHDIAFDRLIFEPQERLSFLTKEEFEEKYQGDIEVIEREHDITNLIEFKEKKEKEQKEQEIAKKEALAELARALEKLEELKSVPVEVERIAVGNIFNAVGDHKEVAKVYQSALKYIDLSLVSFKNVYVSGLDFSGTNAIINPQEVYNKDLSCCDFSGMFVDPIMMNFNGVNIRCAKFGSDNDPYTYDMMPNFSGAIYDEQTTYNGISLYDIIGECEKINNLKK